MKKVLALISAITLGSVVLFTSCGPMKATATNSVNTYITSDPSGATVIYEGKEIGITPCTVSMPVTATAVNAGSFFKTQIVTTVEKWNLKFVKDGVSESVTIDPNAVPMQNGVAPVHYKFRQAAYMHDPTIMAGEADKMVTRDNSGQTSLERTIIRWFFDSEPRGSRVFWRVVSSVPQEVKNTNEQYLGTTPYEETRSFNILGLTYENSRDVQIEVKVVRSGYIDQVKRFNVRQAIDQQEISSFFDLVKADEE